MYFDYKIAFNQLKLILPLEKVFIPWIYMSENSITDNITSTSELPNFLRLIIDKHNVQIIWQLNSVGRKFHCYCEHVPERKLRSN